MDVKKFERNEKTKSIIAISIFVILFVAIIFVFVTGFDTPPKQTKDITIYTANGEKMAEYKGATNVITDSRGGYIHFICDGKDYKYINCPIEIEENSQ